MFKTTRLEIIPKIRFQSAEKIHVAMCFMIYSIWAIVFVNWNYGPDENYRYLIPKFIFENGTLPCGWEESIRMDMWGFSYGFSVYLPYIIAAFFMRLASFFSTEEIILVIATRFVSVLSMTGVAALSIALSKKITASPVRWCFIVLMSLVPQMVFLGSYFNLDSFALLTCELLIYIWITGCDSNWDIKNCVNLGIGIALCFYSYEYAYAFVVASFILYCSWSCINRRQFSVYKFLCRGIVIFGTCFLLYGWVWIRNYILFDGDIFGYQIRSEYAELYAEYQYKPSVRGSFRMAGMSIIDMLRSTTWVQETTMSFVCVLGYMNLYVSNWIYICYNFIFGLGMVGFLLSAVLGKNAILSEARGKNEWTFSILILMMLAISSIINIFMSLFFSWNNAYQPQGRYIIYMAPLLYGIITFGIDRITDYGTIVFRKDSATVKKTTVKLLVLLVMLSVLIATVYCVYVGF